MVNDITGGGVSGLSADQIRLFLDALIEHTPDYVVIVDEHCRPILASKALVHRLGGERAGPGTEHASLDLTPFERSDEPAPADRDPVALALSKRRPEKAERLKLKTAAGQLLPVSAEAFPLTSEGGRLIGAICFYRDIGAEEELLRSREQWRSIISHDLRGPVVTIDLAVRLLMSDPALAGAEEAQSLLERIQRAGTRLDEMIQNLSDATRIESGRVLLHKEAVDLSSMVDAAIESSNVPESRPVRLQREDESLRVSVDPERFEQALVNIIKNAVTHGHRETPIDISIQREKDRAIVAVSNEGPRIPAEERSRVFERFHKLRLSRTSAAEGLGLGLFVTKGLIEAHGGEVWLESESEAPTTFKVAIPLDEA